MRDNMKEWTDLNFNRSQREPYLTGHGTRAKEK